MVWHSVEHAVVMTLGFALGVMLAICMAPGDTMLVVLVTGIVFGIFAREFFDLTFGAEWFWPFGRSHGNRGAGSKPTASHR